MEIGEFSRWLSLRAMAEIDAGRLPRLLVALDYRGQPRFLVDARRDLRYSDADTVEDAVRAISALRPTNVYVLMVRISHMRGLIRLISFLLPSHFLEVTEITGGPKGTDRYIVPGRRARGRIKWGAPSSIFVWESVPPNDMIHPLQVAVDEFGNGKSAGELPSGAELSAVFRDLSERGHIIYLVPEDHEENPTAPFARWEAS